MVASMCTGAGECVVIRSGTLPFPEEWRTKSGRQLPVSATRVLVKQTPTVAPLRPLHIPGARQCTEEETAAPYNLIIKKIKACFPKRSGQIGRFIFAHKLRASV